MQLPVLLSGDLDDLGVQAEHFQLFKKVCLSVMGHCAGSPALLTGAFCIQKLQDIHGPLAKWDQVTHLSHLPTTVHPASLTFPLCVASPLSIRNIPQYFFFYVFIYF